MNPERLDLLLLTVSILGAAGAVWFYITGTLDEDRLVSRWAVIAFVVFGVVIVVTGLGLMLG